VPLPNPSTYDVTIYPRISLFINEEWYSYLLGFFENALDRSYWDVTDEQWVDIEQAIYDVMSLPEGAEMRMKTGSYTGNPNATQSVTGVNFQPEFVIVWARVDGSGVISPVFKIASDGTKSLHGTFLSPNAAAQYEDDHIVSLDVDGFTVGDGTGASYGNVCNVNTRVYSYVAFGQ